MYGTGSPAAPRTIEELLTSRLPCFEERNLYDVPVITLREEILPVRAALSSLAVVEQPKGMLMARWGVSADRALELLTRWSLDRSVKVRILAETMGAAAARGELTSKLPDVLTTRAGPEPTKGPRVELR
jgi:hypothetical protein